MRKKSESILRLPEIYDSGGDLSKKWFVAYFARNPKTQEMERFKIFKGINTFNTLKSRRAAAEKVKEYWTEKLKAGWSPFVSTNVIYGDNLEYQTYIKNYRSMKPRNVAGGT